MPKETTKKPPKPKAKPKTKLDGTLPPGKRPTNPPGIPHAKRG